MRWKEQKVSLPVAALRAGQVGKLAIGGSARHRAMEHLSSSRLEQGGLLLGRLFNEQANASEPIQAVSIDEVVPAHEGIGSEVSLSMPTSVWDSAREMLNANKAWVIVGWYHSHPRLTAFFSGTDKATQKAFFNHPWSIGWVIDPFEANPARAEALFVGPDSEPFKLEHLVEPDDLLA